MSNKKQSLEQILKVPFRGDIVSATKTLTTHIVLCNLGLSMGVLVGISYFIPIIFFVFGIVFGSSLVWCFLVGAYFFDWISVIGKNIVWGAVVTYLTIFGAGTGLPIPLIAGCFVFFLSLPLVLMYVGTMFGTVKAFESGDMTVSSEDGSLFDLLGLFIITLLTLVAIYIGVFVAVGVSTSTFIISNSLLESIIDYRSFWDTLAVAAMPTLAIAVATGIILGLYWQMSIATFGAYRSLNPYLTLKAVIACFPKLFPTSSYQGFLQLLVALIGLVAFDQIVMRYVIFMSLEIGPNLKSIAVWDLIVLAGSGFLLYVLWAILIQIIINHFNLSLCAMSGLVLRSYRHRVAPKRFLKNMTRPKAKPFTWLRESISGFCIGFAFLGFSWLLIMGCIYLAPQIAKHSQSLDFIQRILPRY